MCLCLTKQPNTFSARYVITAAFASYPTQELMARLKVPHGLLPGFSSPRLCRSDTLVALQPDRSSAIAASRDGNSFHSLARPIRFDAAAVVRSRIVPSSTIASPAAKPLPNRLVCAKPATTR